MVSMFRRLKLVSLSLAFIACVSLATHASQHAIQTNPSEHCTVCQTPSILIAAAVDLGKPTTATEQKLSYELPAVHEACIRATDLIRGPPKA
jgi:hypothetical protein